MLKVYRIPGPAAYTSSLFLYDDRELLIGDG